MNRNQEEIHQNISLCDICPNLLLCEGGDFWEVWEKKFILLKNSQSSLRQLSFSSLCSIVSRRIQSVDYIIAITFTFWILYPSPITNLHFDDKFAVCIAAVRRWKSLSSLRKQKTIFFTSSHIRSLRFPSVHNFHISSLSSLKFFYFDWIPDSCSDILNSNLEYLISHDSQFSQKQSCLLHVNMLSMWMYIFHVPFNQTFNWPQEYGLSNKSSMECKSKYIPKTYWHCRWLELRM